MRSETHELPLPELATSAHVNLAAIDLQRFLALCRPSDQRLFEDYLQGYPIEEIARKQGISYTAARIRLLRARRSVQSLIKGRDAVTAGKRLKPIPDRPLAA
jgi:DNA-directed RNA polymerase specialized sigma24 family protein